MIKQRQTDLAACVHVQNREVTHIQMNLEEEYRYSMCLYTQKIEIEETVSAGQ